MLLMMMTTTTVPIADDDDDPITLTAAPLSHPPTHDGHQGERGGRKGAARPISPRRAASPTGMPSLAIDPVLLPSRSRAAPLAF